MCCVVCWVVLCCVVLWCVVCALCVVWGGLCLVVCVCCVVCCVVGTSRCGSNVPLLGFGDSRLLMIGLLESQLVF